ncbi:MAG: acyltransferase [Luteolibacter sp.]
MSAERNTQLDGWRAFAVLGVMWHHWAPEEWRGKFPFEIGLFFFLTLTGFLIGRVLLREKHAGDAIGSPWRLRAYGYFMKRRLTRILIPCYAAMLFAMLVGASDIVAHPWLYLGHVSNFHMTYLPGWPSGTAHYWTLAIQMQMYLLFPLLIYWVPMRWLGWALVGFSALSPVSRWVCEAFFPSVLHPQAITLCAFDYFGIGALLAWTLAKGVPAGDGRWRRVGLVGLAGYLVLRGFEDFSSPVPGFRYFQQTCIAVVFSALISETQAGWRGWWGKLLDHPAIQHIGKLSYGLYLFHTPMPLLIGFVLPGLWHPFFEGPGMILRLGAFGLASWGAAYLCWRFLERAGQPARLHPPVTDGSLRPLGVHVEK